MPVIKAPAFYHGQSPCSPFNSQIAVDALSEGRSPFPCLSAVSSGFLPWNIFLIGLYTDFETGLQCNVLKYVSFGYHMNLKAIHEVYLQIGAYILVAGVYVCLISDLITLKLNLSSLGSPAY